MLREIAQRIRDKRRDGLGAQLRRMEERILARLDELIAQVNRANEALAAVRGDIQVLKDLLANAGDGGLTAEETEQAIQLVQGLADQLSALDAENPAPPAP